MTGQRDKMAGLPMPARALRRKDKRRGWLQDHEVEEVEDGCHVVRPEKEYPRDCFMSTHDYRRVSQGETKCK